MVARRDLYGILRAAPDARGWLPALKSEGQRLVLSVLTLHVESEHSLASPSAVALGELCGYHPQSVRRILGQLEEAGVLTCVGSRPVYTLNGTAHGGRIRIWAVNSVPGEITNRASEGLVGNDSHARPGSLPTAPWKPPNSASEGAPSEELKDLKRAAADSPIGGLIGARPVFGPWIAPRAALRWLDRLRLLPRRRASVSHHEDRRRPETQLARVLGMLLDRDEVCGSEMYAAYIARFSVHIHRLRSTGYQISKRPCDIDSHHHDGTGWLYRLEAVPVTGVQLAMFEESKTG